MNGTPRWTPLAIVYLVLAIAGLIGTWTLNILAVASGSDVVGEWLSNGFATQSLQLDLLVLALACGVLVVIEGRRIGMRRAWLLLPLAAITAAAFVIPLFLALRERRFAAPPRQDEAPQQDEARRLG